MVLGFFPPLFPKCVIADKWKSSRDPSVFRLEDDDPGAHPIAEIINNTTSQDANTTSQDANTTSQDANTTSQDATAFQKHPHRGRSAAMLTFDARSGVSADEVDLLADRFAVELGRMNVYNMVSRSKMVEILEQQNISATISSVERAVELGKLLDVEYMIYGSIGRIGALYTVNVYITSVEKGSIIAGATVDNRGRLEALLTEGMPRAVNNLLRAVMDKQRPGED
jgi:hypothetical protein